MSYRLPRYRVALVREGSCLSEQKTIRSPDDVCSLMGWRGQPRGGSNPRYRTNSETEAFRATWRSFLVYKKV